MAPHVVEAVVNRMSGLARGSPASITVRSILRDRRAALEAGSKYLDRLVSRRRYGAAIT